MEAKITMTFKYELDPDGVYRKHDRDTSQKLLNADLHNLTNDPPSVFKCIKIYDLEFSGELIDDNTKEC